MSEEREIDRATLLASKILDDARRDPDDDLALMCRQFQRSREREAILRNMLVTAVTLIDGLLEAMDMPDIPAVQRGRAVAARIRASLETRQ